jgi:ornithine--oxo-acid transaminase
VLVEEGMIENAANLGRYFIDALRSLKDPKIKEIRGKGLMIGIEFHPEVGGARQYSEKLMAEGMLCKETHDHIIRIAPPLVITRDDIDWALEKIAKVLRAN